MPNPLPQYLQNGYILLNIIKFFFFIMFRWWWKQAVVAYFVLHRLKYNGNKKEGDAHKKEFVVLFQGYYTSNVEIPVSSKCQQGYESRVSWASFIAIGIL